MCMFSLFSVPMSSEINWIGYCSESCLWHCQYRWIALSGCRQQTFRWVSEWVWGVGQLDAGSECRYTQIEPWAKVFLQSANYIAWIGYSQLFLSKRMYFIITNRTYAILMWISINQYADDVQMFIVQSPGELWWGDIQYNIRRLD